jgi:hypothetical protein
MNDLLCSKSEAIAVIEYYEKEKLKLLIDLAMFFPNKIDIEIYPVTFPMGISVAADLFIDGKLFQKFELVSLCLLTLNNLILKCMLEERKDYV